MCGSSASCWCTSGVVGTPTRNRTTRRRRCASAAQQHAIASLYLRSCACRPVGKTSRRRRRSESG
eukprot:6028245-Heterocapsa_arctica.AAC.1